MAGPAELLVGFAVSLSVEQTEALQIPAPPTFSAALLLGVAHGPDGLVPWARAGDPAVTMALLSGYSEDPAVVARRFPFVVEGWPQQWPGVSLAGLVPDRLPRPMLLAV